MYGRCSIVGDEMPEGATWAADGAELVTSGKGVGADAEAGTTEITVLNAAPHGDAARAIERTNWNKPPESRALAVDRPVTRITMVYAVSACVSSSRCAGG